MRIRSLTKDFEKGWIGNEEKSREEKTFGFKVTRE